MIYIDYSDIPEEEDRPEDYETKQLLIPKTKAE